jgi:hypothetical protein
MPGSPNGLVQSRLDEPTVQDLFPKTHEGQIEQEAGNCFPRFELRTSAHNSRAISGGILFIFCLVLREPVLFPAYPKFQIGKDDALKFQRQLASMLGWRVIPKAASQDFLCFTSVRSPVSLQPCSFRSRFILAWARKFLCRSFAALINK